MNFITFIKLLRVVVLSMALIAVLVGTAAAQKGTFTDSRDGQKYRTVKMPDGKVWMAENLRYKLGDSWCYNDKESVCEQFGRLYDWNMAKIACPKGWHLPSGDEWTDLVTVVGSKTGGKKLKSTSGWLENSNGTDDFGFSAYAAGYRDTKGEFRFIGTYGFWWAENNGRYFLISGDYMNVDLSYEVSSGYSVRCVAD